MKRIAIIAALAGILNVRPFCLSSLLSLASLRHSATVSAGGPSAMRFAGALNAAIATIVHKSVECRCWWASEIDRVRWRTGREGRPRNLWRHEIGVNMKMSGAATIQSTIETIADRTIMIFIDEIEACCCSYLPFFRSSCTARAASIEQDRYLIISGEQKWFDNASLRRDRQSSNKRPLFPSISMPVSCSKW